MSDVTALAKGELSIPQFVTKVVGEINANPVLKSAAAMILMLLEPVIMKEVGSSAVAASIINDVAAGLRGDPPLSANASALTALGV